MSPLDSLSSPNIEERRRWMGTLAKARPDRLDELWQTLAEKPDYRCLKGPEIGLAMVRGRTGGTGAPFNMGEMSVTRCVVQIVDGQLGYACVAGRRERHAELAAVFDALLQNGDRRAALKETIISPLDREWLSRRAKSSAKAASTKVEFFTMVRGD